jgi:hypothetical protein
MSFRSDFVSSPETFMATNVVTPQFLDPIGPGYEGPPSESRPIVITIASWPNKKCSKSGGGCYYFTRNVAGLSQNERLPIFWLAYKQNNFTQGTLTNNSRYMFTALMNGCSLGFGSQTGDGTCLVSHANKSSEGANGRVAQKQAQQGQLQSVFGTNSYDVIEPDSYQGTTHGNFTLQATNFGKNENGTWKFYTHKWMASGGNGGVILNCGVAPAVSVPG